MADISKITLGSTTYSLKDSEARSAIAILQSAVASSLVFKGVITSATDLTGLTDYKLGWTYKAGATMTITGLGTVENGDMLVCIADGTSYSASDWSVVQNNVDTMEGATANTSGTRGLVPAPSTGDQEKFLCGNGTWASPSLTWGSFTDIT